MSSPGWPRTPALDFFPDPGRSAATEYQPELGRGMVRGTVHDEAAWSLGGASGNAGMFGTAPALLDFGEALRAGLPGILSRASWRTPCGRTSSRRCWARPCRRPAPSSATGWACGSGRRRGWVPPGARGHNGFTGTSLLVDRDAGISVVLLGNRVHPRRELSDVQPVRLAVSRAVYSAVS